MAFKVNDDHWAFLDDIEAPMWADLSLEVNPKFNDQDIDDKWFYTSHQFHQCSSSHLKSLFSHSGDEIMTLDSDLLVQSSPNLPHSVSKSRGKQYRSKKWKGDSQGISFDKVHPVKVLTGKSPCVKLGPKNDVRHKSKSMNLNETSTSNISVVCGSSSSGKAESKSLSACGGPISRVSSEANKMSISNATSTITSESGQQQQFKGMDVSSHAFGQTNGLLSMMKKSLRKSYITRQATRVEINNDGKQLRGRNSTSSKSSVGSSSNPRHDVGILSSSSVRPKEITPDSRNVARMSYAAKSKMNPSGVAKAATMKTEERLSNNRRGKVNTAKPAHNEAAKQKVQYRDSRTKALVPSGVNEQNSTLSSTKLKKKTGTSVSHTSIGEGKENVTRRTSMIQKKSNGRGIAGREGIGCGDQKVTKQSLSGSTNLAGSICSKGKGRCRGNSEKPKNLVQRVHFR